jgi:nucleotide-binding universal stress UspA family protein
MMVAGKEDPVLGLSEQEIREGLEEELIRAMRAEGGAPTIHAIAHSIARILEQDHLRVAEQLAQAGLRLGTSRPSSLPVHPKHIVVGFDGSEHAQRALERAVDLAGPETTVTVVAAFDVFTPTGGRRADGTPADPHEASEGSTALAEACAFLAERGVEALPVEGFGDPSKLIAETAADAGADLVVVGTRGRNLAERLMLGSVSTGVVHRAPCDVLVVR